MPASPGPVGSLLSLPHFEREWFRGPLRGPRRTSLGPSERHVTSRGRANCSGGMRPPRSAGRAARGPRVPDDSCAARGAMRRESRRSGVRTACAPPAGCPRRCQWSLSHDMLSDQPGRPAGGPRGQLSPWRGRSSCAGRGAPTRWTRYVSKIVPRGGSRGGRATCSSHPFGVRVGRLDWMGDGIGRESASAPRSAVSAGSLPVGSSKAWPGVRTPRR